VEAQTDRGLDLDHVHREGEQVAVFHFRKRRTRRFWLAGLIISALAVVFVTASGANLAGSTFESNDGNLVVNTSGNEDWANAPNLVVKTEAASGSADDAFGQGAKEDISCPTEVTGSIPPNKSDLSRFYVSHETGSNGHFLVYLAWERTNVLGSANMDFEFNQSSVLCGNEPAASAVPIRTAGDILITFDFTQGGGNPVLGLLSWVTSGSKSQCFSANAVPCWGNRVNLSAAGFADGAVNSVSVTDPINPGAPRTLPALTFGEAAVDLTSANVFPSDACNPFASIYLKSRSSASFPAELKDFIPPANAKLANCGALKITKTSSKDDSPLAGATFTIKDPDGNPLSGSPFTTDSNGEICVDKLPFGDYEVQETGAPTGYKIDDTAAHTVTVDNAASCADDPYDGDGRSFTDTPLTKIEVIVTSQAGAGVTNSSIVCDSGAADSENGADDPAFDDTDETFSNLPPGTYNCQVVVDP
jgi:hypothetical protein